MALDLRMPNITGASEREQLAQIRSYLYQIVPQLQWALNNIDTSSSSAQVVQQVINKTGSSTAPTDAETTFNAIKSLIIKSADIVQAYYEEINSRLYSEYKALSDFGIYTEQTEKLVRDTAAYTETIYTRLATIESDVDGMEEPINDYRESQGYIKTGIIVDSLSKDEAPKYGKQEGKSLIGIEVGETTDEEFKKFARFTPTRLSFYDTSDIEVAYVSNEKLYINNVEITSGYKIGGYVDTVTAGGGVVTKWVGGV